MKQDKRELSNWLVQEAYDVYTSVGKVNKVYDLGLEFVRYGKDLTFSINCMMTNTRVKAGLGFSEFCKLYKRDLLEDISDYSRKIKIY